MKTGCRVHEIMSKEVHQTGAETPVTAAAQLMNEFKVGSVVITEEDVPIGIITEQDIARKVVAQHLDPKVTSVRSVMSDKLISTQSTRDVYDAAILMKTEEIKHLPVIDDGVLQGIVTAKDIIRIEPYLVEKLSFKASLSKENAKKLFSKL